MQNPAQTDQVSAEDEMKVMQAMKKTLYRMGEEMSKEEDKEEMNGVDNLLDEASANK